MADLSPIRALRYDPAVTGGLEDVVAPPYDVIDEAQRERLEARSPYNVVHVDLPRGGEDRYERAAATFAEWRAKAVVVLDESPALWTLVQEYTGPDGKRRTRTGVLARVRVEQYGPGTIRPHERTHPGPREDRLRLTRATRVNLSPIFSLYDDPGGGAREALARATRADPWAVTTDEDGTVNTLHRTDEPEAIAALVEVLAGTELLIADGHHRYETARVYADEVGGDGPHRHVLMCLVALQDPGLTVFPTHRLVRGLRPEQREALATALRRDFEIVELADRSQLAPPRADGTLTIGYIDSHLQRPFALTLRSPESVASALPERSAAYRALDTAVLEAVVLKGALAMTDDDIDELNGLGYARDAERALDLVATGEYEAAFLMAPTPVTQIQQVAAAGESMPPKSTYFYPKVPTGLVFNPLA